MTFFGVQPHIQNGVTKRKIQSFQDDKLHVQDKGQNAIGKNSWASLKSTKCLDVNILVLCAHGKLQYTNKQKAPKAGKEDKDQNQLGSVKSTHKKVILVLNLKGIAWKTDSKKCTRKLFVILLLAARCTFKAPRWPMTSLKAMQFVSKGAGATDATSAKWSRKRDTLDWSKECKKQQIYQRMVQPTWTNYHTEATMRFAKGEHV